jgi:hypothetical protein
MTNVKELMLGNYILDDEGLLSKVVGFAPYDHSVRCDEKEGCQIKIDFWSSAGEYKKGWVVDSPECTPIPVTPEWLGRLGFITDGQGDDNHPRPLWNHPKTKYQYSDGSLVYNGTSYDDWHDIGSVDYVHQLQNLFFFVTGEELTINNEHLQTTS